MTTTPRRSDGGRPVRPAALPTASALAYGGDWNPEQWDAATVDQDIAMMREAGVTLVSLGIFSWARLEPEEGRYDLDWLGDLIDRLHDAGIDVDLATGTASPPAWMAVNHPESLPVAADGTRLGFGSRQQYSPSSRVYRERSQALAGELARRFGHHPGVVLWHVGNEYGCHVHECFSDQSAADFQEWLAARHGGDIESLNEAWSTDFWSQRYSSFDQIRPPRSMPTFPNPAQVLDWRRFCNDQILACMEGEIQAIRAHSDRPVTTNFMGSFPWLDYRRWASRLDLIADDSYPDPADPASAHEIAWAGDLMRGLGDGAPWLLMEQTPGAVQWRPRNSRKRPGQFLLWSLERVAHGADGILQFQWRQSRGGSEAFHSGMVPHSGRASRTWREAVGTGRVLRALAPVAGTRVNADVAILLDWEAQWARHSAIGPTEPGAPFAAAHAWHRTLWEAGIASDIVFPDSDLAGGGHRLIIVAEQFTDLPEVASALRRAVESGAQVLVTAPTGVVDTDMRAVLGGYLGGLRELLGVRVVDHAPLTGSLPSGWEDAGVEEDPGAALVDRLTRTVSAPARQTWCGLEAVSPSLRRALDRIGTPAPDLRGGMWAEEIGPALPGEIDEADPLSFAHSSVEVVAVFDGRGGAADLAGHAAITRRAAGAQGGAAWYAASDLDAVGRAALLAVLTAHARVQPVMAGLPDGVEAQRRGDVLFLLNHSDSAAEVAGVVGVDLVSGAACTGHVVIAPRSGIAVRQPE
ncbi:MAG: beta-galactosidase [Actinomyces sp.]|jgi:beta-galactosidase|nr:beta-galactosidase [Actinomyces sp.]MCI1641857.1 beta-galactosidase [Actinomyces sp.]MCI1662037.1 beta-galactosidase [Actinomyces sp.]MCI1690763.1 beta-galactosidase [Actinomyces sp.]